VAALLMISLLWLFGLSCRAACTYNAAMRGNE
jgi:hypothetical protein